MEYVIAVAEERSFTRAAARCLVVQSALSHQIKALEVQLGVTLFARNSRRVELTAAGEAFLPAARASLDAADRAVAEAAAATGELRGSLRVGMIPTVTAVDVPVALKTFRLMHPRVRIALRVAGSNELEAAIVLGDLDVGLLGLPDGRRPRGVAWRDMGSDRLVAVMSRENPVADLKEVRLEQLSGETFADFPAGTPGRAQSDLAFAAAGVGRDVSFESMATDLIVGLVRQNLAVCMLPSRFAPRDALLVSVPVIDGPTRIEYVVWSDFNPSAAAQAFLDTISLQAPR